ncbi:MAG TPA: hypothetical protein PKY82_26860 [Pyrinomonadaceae bacterium]|nr:hypothetical protein [Pyrinomonadaceae bacterium]
MKSGRFIFLVLLIGLLFSKTFGKDDWFEIKTKNFIITGNTNQNTIQGIAEKLEKFHQIFTQSFPKNKIQTPFQTNIIVFKDVDSLNNYKISKGANKYFLSGNDANYGIISPDNTESFEKNFEGYARFLLENNIGRNNLPSWLFEGLGEYFQTIKFNDDKNFEIGNSLKNSGILQQNKLIPVNVLLETDNFTLQNQGEDRKSLFRAESWALLQLLLKDSNNFEKVEKFIEMRKQGNEVKKSLNDSFQTNSFQLNEELPKYIQQNNFSKQKSSLEFGLTAESTQVPETKGLATVADYLFYTDRLKEAEALIEKILKTEQKQTLALTTLSLIKTKQFYYDEAQKLAEKAIEIEPNNFLTYYRLALSISKQGMTEYGFVSGYSRDAANQMGENLIKSIALNPQFTESYALFAFINFVRNEQLDESIQFITRVLQISPGNHQYQLRFSELNMRKEKFFEARKLAIQVLQNTPNEGVKLYAQNTIQRIDATEFQLERIRNEKAKFVNDDIVSEKPLSEEEIKKLREKATNDQIKAVLRRPQFDEKRIFGNLKRIECAKNRIDFVISTQTGLIKFQSNSFDGINFLSLVPEMSDYRLGCGTLVKENNASIIFKSNNDSLKTGEIISIEFVPKSFKP